MIVTPRYGEPPVLDGERFIGDPSLPLIRQRRRLAGILATLDAEQWAMPSRCELWPVRDVVAHLMGINQLWLLSIAGGRTGRPTRLFDSFDPVTTPCLLLDDVRDWSPSAVLDGFAETTESLADMVGDMEPDEWSLTGESPLGHVSLHLVAVHALWDSWIHERDVLLPLGLAPVEEPDEVLACLAYAAAIGPALLATNGSTRRRTMTVNATSPIVQLSVDAGERVVVRDTTTPDGVVLTGRAVDLIEGFSFRVPLDADIDADDLWLFGGLESAFDQESMT